eukprot:SAG31_NODE_540_length_14288_cov_51.958066_5_plen_56_part_00
MTVSYVDEVSYAYGPVSGYGVYLSTWLLHQPILNLVDLIIDFKIVTLLVVALHTY